MKLEFSDYNIEQLLEEKSFISWVLREENNQEWEEFLATNPGMRLQVNKSRNIINLLKDQYDPLDEQSVLELWINLESFEKHQKSRFRKLKFRKILSLAASFLIIISLGFFIYLFNADYEDDYIFSSTVNQANDEALIILYTGEEVSLKEENSNIAFSEFEDQVVVNDSLIVLGQKEDVARQDIQMNEVLMPYGKKTELVLPDGTKVWLNAGSRIAFPSRFEKNSRTVFLEGEACFLVVNDARKKFIVKTGELDIKVLGTHFNVSAYPSEEIIETVLLEGSVVINKPKKMGRDKIEIELHPSQKASFNRANRNVDITNEEDTEKYIAWTYGWLNYSRESLQSVLKKVERFYNAEIELPPNYPTDDIISGKLDLKNSLEEVMLALSDASDFDYRIFENKVIITKKTEPLKRR